MDDKVVNIYYKNHRDQINWRTIRPIRIYYGSTLWHGEPQWLLEAWDLGKNADRCFAMKDILKWETR